MSKRRRVARKKFKEENPHLFPQPDTPQNDAGSNADEKKKKKKPFKTLKGGVAKSGNGNNKRMSSSSKHPLRIPGQRPGEGCFVCGAATHLAKACPEKAEWEKNKVCSFSSIILFFVEIKSEENFSCCYLGDGASSYSR